MPELHLWHGRSCVELEGINCDDQDVTKVSCHENNVLLLTVKGTLYLGTLTHVESGNLRLTCKKLPISAVDFGCTLQKAYILGANGQTTSCPLETLYSAQDETVLQIGSENITLVTPKDINARSICVGSRGIAYIDEAGQLWASGWQKELGIDHPHLDSPPTPIEVFIGRPVVDVSLGADFGLALLQPLEGQDDRSSPSSGVRVVAEQRSGGVQSVLANVDVATDYLKRQLSWVSGDVVCFVKNVGEYVPYRQRRESTGSESFEELALDESARGEQKSESPTVELLQLPSGGRTLEGILLGGNKSPARSEESVLTESFHASSSSSTLNSQGSEGERAMALSRAGLALLDTEVYSWGSAKCGQLGHGDMVKRTQPSVIQRLRGCGVRKIVTGSHHALALLLDGRVFLWGERSSSGGNPSTPETFPRQLQGLPDGARALDVSAHNDTSFVLASQGRVFMLSRHSSLVELSWKGESCGAHRLLSSCQLCACVTAEARGLSENQHARLAQEQQFLEDMIEVRRSLLQRVEGSSRSEVETLLRWHRALLGLTALHVAALAQSPAPARPYSETLALYRYFLAALGDAIACGAMHQVVERGKHATVLATLLRPLDHVGLLAAEARTELGEGSEQAKAWRRLHREARSAVQAAENTRQLWESLAAKPTLRCQLEEGGRHRRLLRDSRQHPLLLVGAGRFSGPHWFLLMSDCLAHVTGGQVEQHDLRTLWVDPLPDSTSIQNALSLTVPESSLTVRCQTTDERAEWLSALQNAVKAALHKTHLPTPPFARVATHTFVKHPSYKGATYTGRWAQGLPEGQGRMQWMDGRVYEGSFQGGLMHGRGRLSTEDGGSFEGQWVDGMKSGYGVEKMGNGSVYEGYFWRGHAHGHGVRKEGRFLSSAASVYVGEWAAGRRHGYGVSDEISSGEKYLGLWANDLKQGCGMVVTLDGIYYEGNFSGGNLTGRGVMVWEDGSCYEGEFGAAGVFAGRGRLLLSSGDVFEGTLHGAWNEDVKMAGTFRKSVTASPTIELPKPNLFGRLSVVAGEKWRPLFRECLRQLGVPPGTEDGGWEAGGVSTARAWERVAVALAQVSAAQPRSAASLDTIPQYGRGALDTDTYQRIKAYLAKAFDELCHPLGLLLHQLCGAYTATYGGVRVHPVLLEPAVKELHSLCSRLYQVVRLLFPALPPPGLEASLPPPRNSASLPDMASHQQPPRQRAHSDTQETSDPDPRGGEGEALLLQPVRDRAEAEEQRASKSPEHATSESQLSNSRGGEGEDLLLQSVEDSAETEEQQASKSPEHAISYSRRDSQLSSISEGGDFEDSEVVSAAGLLLPLLLPRVHSALFVLYALHNKQQDDEYWRKLLKWNRQRDVALMAFLGIERQLWPSEEEEHSMFGAAVESLQQLKTTFAPLEKLLVIRTTFQYMTAAVTERVGSSFLWTMDALIPVFQLVVIRAQVLQLGSEIHFIENFMEPRLLNGELGIMFTTLKACYFQILQERVH